MFDWIVSNIKSYNLLCSLLLILPPISVQSHLSIVHPVPFFSIVNPSVSLLSTLSLHTVLSCCLFHLLPTSHHPLHAVLRFSSEKRKRRVECNNSNPPPSSATEHQPQPNPDIAMCIAGRKWYGPGGIGCKSHPPLLLFFSVLLAFYPFCYQSWTDRRQYGRTRPRIKPEREGDILIGQNVRLHEIINFHV